MLNLHLLVTDWNIQTGPELKYRLSTRNQILLCANGAGTRALIVTWQSHIQTQKPGPAKAFAIRCQWRDSFVTPQSTTNSEDPSYITEEI